MPPSNSTASAPDSPHLLRAQELLRAVRGQDLDDSRASETAIEVAGELLDLSTQLQTHTERKQQQALARLMHDRKGQLFSTLLTDRIPRLTRGSDIVRQALNVLKQTGIPQSMPTVDRAQLHALKTIGPLLGPLVGAAVRKRIRSEALPFLIPGDPSHLTRAVKELTVPGRRVNVNQLGEEVLGSREAERHMEDYLKLLANPVVTTISVKVSSICAQLNVLAWDMSLDRVCSALERLYRAAMEGPGAPKVVMLDMEAYRDLELTHCAFVRVLSQPEFHKLSAGIVLQAYLPDSHRVQTDLIQWAQSRCANGGAPIRMRLVKGANLAVERIEASLTGWALPIFESKQLVDASYKTILDRGLTPDALKAVALGIASHNLLDVAYALVRIHQRELSAGYEFEVLTGIAASLSRALLALGMDVLVYCPAVTAEHLHSAVAYLVRRLDENTAEENFLRHSFEMKRGDAAWSGQVDGFLASRALQAQLDITPKRQPRRLPIPNEPEQQTSAVSSFHNEMDTDFTVRENRESLQGELSRVYQQTPPHLSLSIGGASVTRDPVAGFDPSRPDTVPYHLSLATADDVEFAITTGNLAKERWQKTSPSERVQRIRQVARALANHRFGLIAAMVMDGGKAVQDADAEVSEAIDFANYYAATYEELLAHKDVKFQPRGLTVVTPPWNFPLAIPLGGVFAALVTGNTVILKPAQETAYVATRAVELCYQAGIPQDVLQLVVAEDSIATELITDKRVRTVVLTGGTATAKLFRKLRPDLHLLAETGGKNATIVSRFCDRDLAVNAIIQSAFGHAGQKCSATSLLIVTEELANDERFVAQLTDAASSMAVGSAWELNSRVTPLIHPPSGVLEQGLTTLDEGEFWWLEPKQANNPRLWSPGIKAGVRPGSFSHTTEFFGPLLSVLVARDLDQAIDWANATPYGLTAGFHSLDEGECHRFIERMEAGNLYVNRTTTGAIVQRQPFGGRKASCFGPGCKAGGPNYVSMFLHMSQHAPYEPPEAKDPIKLPTALHTATQVLGTQAEEHAQNDYAVATHYFHASHDPSHLRGQDNLFRYQCHMPVLVIAFPGAETATVARTALAMMALGVPFEICSSIDVTGIDIGTLTEAFGSDVVRPESWQARLNARSFGRVRAIGTPPKSAYKAALAHVPSFDPSPVLDNPRLELSKYTLEQSVSIDYHRHGHLGLRELQIP